jgi:hypothetical protein
MREQRVRLDDMLGGDLGRRDHRPDAVDGQSRPDLERPDATMCDRAAQDGRMQHPLTQDVADKFAAPAQEAQILDPFDRRADIAVGEGHVSPLR